MQGSSDNSFFRAEQERLTGGITTGWTRCHHTWEEGLSSLCVHKLHLHAGRHPTPVAPLGLHLVLDGANWIHSTEQVSRSYMSRVHKICWLSNHASVNPPAPFRLRLFCNTAVETQPEFTHAYSPQYKWAPVKFSNLSSGSFTKHAPW